jgi:hypothetical protein
MHFNYSDSQIFYHHHQWHHSPINEPWPLPEDSQQISFYRVRLSASRANPNQENQVSVFIPPGDRVAQLYSWTLGSSGTSGSPFPVPTYVGPWGANFLQSDKIWWQINWVNNWMKGGFWYIWHDPRMNTAGRMCKVKGRCGDTENHSMYNRYKG